MREDLQRVWDAMSRAGVMGNPEDMARAAIEAALPWRKIDTAPRTGDPILGCQGSGEDYQIFEMVWEPGYGWRDPAWDGGYDPSHWMPRPAPPPEENHD